MSTATTVLHISDFRMAGFLIACGAKFVGTVMGDKSEVLLGFDDVVLDDGIAIVTEKGLLNTLSGTKDEDK